MDDAQAPPAGTKGTVKGVDDTGSLLMRWDNGSGLNVVYGEDIVSCLLYTSGCRPGYCIVAGVHGSAPLLPGYGLHRVQRLVLGRIPA